MTHPPADRTPIVPPPLGAYASPIPSPATPGYPAPMNPAPPDRSLHPLPPAAYTIGIPQAPRGIRQPQRRSIRLRIAAVGAMCGLFGGVIGAGAIELLNADSTPPFSTAASGTAPAASGGTIEAVAHKALPSVVQISVKSADGSSAGSGVIISSDGNILTNYHVVAGAVSSNAKLRVATADGTAYDAEYVGGDPSADLAIIRADGADDLVAATFADSSKVQVGEEVVAIGAPAGLSNTVTSGIVSYVGRGVSASAGPGAQSSTYEAIQTDASINPGNSGGPLLNSDGDVIGINSVIYSPSSDSSSAGSVGLGFAIPSNTALELASTVLQ